MGVRTCMFCGSQEKLTRAHIVSKSMLKQLPKDPTLQLLQRESRAEGNEWIDDVTISNIDPRERFVKILCEPCNGQWMASVERRAEPILLKLAAGELLTLSREDQHAVSLWAVVATSIRGKLSKVPQSVFRTHCASIRETEQIPDGFMVWIVRGERRDDLPSRHLSYFTTAGLGYLSWIWLGNTIIAVGSPNGSEAAADSLMQIGPMAECIHPQGRERLEWPPFPDYPDVCVRYAAFLAVAPFPRSRVGWLDM